uniref:Uncharacterized protein n=1 Tax=Echeneis naucrates TaxID=173247 RepID=A0A665TEL6_ECHNA
SVPSRSGSVPVLISPGLDQSRSGSVLVWISPGLDQSRSGSVPVWICPGLDQSRSGSVPVWNSSGLDLSRSGSVPVWISPGLDQSQSGSVPVWISPGLQAFMKAFHQSRRVRRIAVFSLSLSVIDDRFIDCECESGGFGVKQGACWEPRRRGQSSVSTNKNTSLSTHNALICVKADTAANYKVW